MALHPVATIRDQVGSDFERAFVTMIWLLRNELSVTLDERSGLSVPDTRIANGAIALATMLDAGAAHWHLVACLRAIEAACAHRALSRSEQNIAGSTGATDTDRTTAAKNTDRHDASAIDLLKLAKSEAHRALARATERFPDAFDRE